MQVACQFTAKISTRKQLCWKIIKRNKIKTFIESMLKGTKLGKGKDETFLKQSLIKFGQF